ncbi:hypothetical protein IJG66_01780, partial [Candidatus Saccharibacteria bacterium]|nr:hypothetical protein [Candidatus Saccharibacteria bacterium]
MARKDDLEIPLGKRKPLYRFFEILPGFLSYLMVILLVVLSLVNPTIAAIYLLAIITTTLVKAVAVAYRTVQGYNIVKKACRVDWHKRLADLSQPHEAFERLRGVESEAYGFSEHVQNLKMMSVGRDLTVGDVALDTERGALAFPEPEQIYHAVIMVA